MINKFVIPWLLTALKTIWKITLIVLDWIGTVVISIVGYIVKLLQKTKLGQTRFGRSLGKIWQHQHQRYGQHRGQHQRHGGISLQNRPALWGAVFVLIVFLPLALLRLKTPEETEAAWFDDGWGYRQTVAITNAGTAQTNFQVAITLNTSALVTAGKMQSDCDDIRITDVSGKMLPIWIETGTNACNTTTTKIWTKIPTLSTSGNTIYLYYGNPSAISNRNSSVLATACSGINAYLGSGLYFIDPDGLGSTTPFQAYCDMTTDSGGWSLVASWNTSQEWTKTSTSTSNVFGTTALDAVSSNFGNASLTDFRILASDAVTTTGSSAYADWYYHYNSATTWKEVWAPTSNTGGHVSDGYMSTTPRQSLKPFNYSYNIRFSYQVTQTYNNLSDWGYTGAATSGCLPNYWNTLTTAGGSFGVFSTNYYSGSDGANCAGAVSDGTLGLCPSNIPGCITGQDVGNTNAKIGYDDGGAYSRFGSTGTTNVGDNPGSDATTKLWWFIRSSTPINNNFSVASPTNEEKSQGPVAYWKFDEGYGTSTNDATQNNYDGSLGSTAGTDAGAPTWATEDQCLSGKCLQFDGTNDAVDFGDYDDLKALQFDTGNWSVSAWIRAPSGSSKRVVFGLKTGDDQDFNIGINTSNRAYVEWVSYPSKPSYTTTTSSSTIADNKWHQIGAKREGGTITLYVDGVSVGTDSTVGSYDITGPPWFSRWTAGAWFFGCCTTFDAGVWQNFFKGFIDEPKIYNYARTAAQIKSDYTSRGASKGTSAALGGSKDNLDALSNGLVGYWKMDESSWTNNCAATSVTDSSGNANNGKSCPATTGPTGGASGKFGNAGSFDGIDDGINVGTITPTGAATFSSWIYINGANSKYGVIFSNWGSGGNAFFIGTLAASSSTIVVYFNGTNIFNITSVPLNTWVHLAISHTGSIATAYINGVQTNSVASSLISATGVTSIGYDINRVDYPFKGSIDESRVYNRSLSPKEVRDLYAWAPGPTTHYNFDQNTNDVSGSGLNFATTKNYTPGKFGKALIFEGGTAGTTASTDILNTDTHTIEFWIQFTGYTSGWQGIFNYKPTGSDRSPGIWRHSSGRMLHWRYDPGNTGSNIYLNGLEGGTQFSDNTWYHVAGTKDGSTFKVYVNGSYIGSATVANPKTSGSSPFYFGSAEVNIDDFKIYNYARTAKQIVEDMNAGHPAGGSPVGSQVGYWKFDEGTDNTCTGGTNDTCNSGNGGSALDGAQSGMAVPATSASGWTNSGKFSKALSFDGTNDYANFGANSDFVYQEGQQWTTSLWFKTTTSYTGINGGKTLFGKGTGGAVAGYAVNIGQLNSQGYDNKIGFTIDASPGYNYVKSTDSLPVANDGSWHYVAIVFDASSGTYVKGTIYFDGKNYGTIDSAVAKSGWTTTNLQKLTAGSIQSGSGQFFTGQIDEVKIYGSALTEDEIKIDMNRGAAMVLGSTKSGDIVRDGLVLYLDANDISSYNGSGTTWYDISGQRYQATMRNLTSTNWVTVDGIKAFETNDTDNQGFSVASWNQTTARTWEIWIKEKSTGIGWQTWIDNNGSERILFGTPNTSWYVYPDFNTSGVTAGQWAQFAFTMDDNKNVRMFKNGVLVSAPGVYTNTLTLGSQTLYLLGDTGTEISSAYTGIIRSYNRKLADEEIKKNFDEDAPTFGLAGGYGTDDGKLGDRPPVAEWKMDEKTGSYAYDTSGNGNTGSLAGSPVWRSAGECKVGACLTLDRVDDRMTVNHSTSLEPASITVEAWIKLNDIGDRHILITKWLGYSFEISAARYPYFRLNGISPTDLYSSQAITWGRWHHIAATLDNATKQRRIYLDGVNTGSETVTGSISYNQAGLAIPYSSATWASGAIDQVKIYDYARTPAQIAYDYNRGGPAGWWKMDECQGGTANDASGNGNNGTITIGATGSQTAVGTCTTASTAWGNGVTGKYNSSLNFDGTDDYIEITDPATSNWPLDISNSNTMSISAWIKPSAGDYRTIVSKGYNSTDGSYALRITRDSEPIKAFFQVYNSSGTIGSAGTYSNISNGTWYHITGVYNGSQVCFYVNGKLDGSCGSLTGNIKTNDLPLRFGRLSTAAAATEYFPGQIDDVRIYNYALTDNQVKTLYNQGSAIQFAPATGSP
ncbi:DUF2341 domain-containing protein [Patescibacteria group bacterium]|nr:DUF2341 domain-containing protein [Patescibacteria group bacterium]